MHVLTFYCTIFYIDTIVQDISQAEYTGIYIDTYSKANTTISAS